MSVLPGFGAVQAPSAALALHVWGQAASFTRYDAGGERDTYPVLHPVAAEAVLKAVYWHPMLSYVIRQIDVLRPVELYVQRGSELAAHPGLSGVDVSSAHTRTLRSRRLIHAPEYVIYADLALHPDAVSAGQLSKAHSIFSRRARKGQCFERPYFGLRDCPADFAPAHSGLSPYRTDADLGQLPLWREYQADPAAGVNMTHFRPVSGTSWERLTGPGRITSHFFHAQLSAGSLRVPDYAPWERRVRGVA